MNAALKPALEALAAGKMIVITGDRLRGGDIDLCLAARHVTPQAVNLLGGYGARGRDQAEAAKIVSDASAVARACCGS